MHFTHIDHLPSIISNGLVADSGAQDGLLTIEAGQPSIKQQRRSQPVTVPPGGVVSDYVPFYFAARSPTMSAISNGRVPSFKGERDDLIYLATTTQHLVDKGLQLVFTDRNAALAYAKVSPESSSDDLVDWGLMQQRYWSNTSEEPDRRERRMAECLVWQAVPFDGFLFIATHGQPQEEKVKSVLEQAGHSTDVGVRSDWYI